MSNDHVKRQGAKSSSAPQSGNKSDIIFYTAAAIAVVLVLGYLPELLGLSGLPFLSAGSGLNKLLSVVFAALIGWACLLPSQSYKNFISLARGARTEWRKTVKPDKDTVVKTTMMVLALVIVFALMVLLLDTVFGSVLRAFVN